MTKPRAVLSGEINLETIALNDQLVCVNALGGSLIYSAAGYSIWEDNAGLHSITSSEVSDEQILKLRTEGFNSDGILRADDSLHAKQFILIKNEKIDFVSSPIEWFLNHKIPLPRTLLGYSPRFSSKEQNGENVFGSFKAERLIPPSFLGSKSLLVNLHGTQEYLRLVTALNYPQIRIIVLYQTFFQQVNKNFLQLYLQGDQCVVFHKDSLQTLEKYDVKLGDPERAMIFLQNFGCEHLFLIAQDRVYFSSRKESKQLEILRYPVFIKNRINEQSAFAGGMLAGLAKGCMVDESALMGIVSMSIVNQLLPVQAKPEFLTELPHARLEWLKTNSTYL